MMAAMRHPNVVMYLGVCLEPPAVLTEFCARGSLNDVLKKALTKPDLAGQLDWSRRYAMQPCTNMKLLLYFPIFLPPSYRSLFIGIIRGSFGWGNVLGGSEWSVQQSNKAWAQLRRDSLGWVRRAGGFGV